MWIFQGRINRKKQGILKGKKQEVQKVRKWLRRKSTRLCLSLLSGLLAVGFTGNTADMDKYTKASQYSGHGGGFCTLIFAGFRRKNGKRSRMWRIHSLNMSFGLWNL